LMNLSDGLLAIEISRAENISFRDAIQLIENEVANARQELKNRKNVEIGNLGILSLNGENKLIFVPSEKSTFHPANYGLSVLYYSKIAQVTEEQNKTITISLPHRSKMARYAAAGIVVLGLMISTPKLNDVKHTTASLNPVSIIQIQKPSVEQEDTVQVSNVQYEQVNSKQQTIANAEKSEEAKYHVIVSCMPTQKMADDLCTHLKRNNHTNAVVLSPVKTFRVSIESFVKMEDAILYMENLRKSNSEFSDAWVLSK